MTAHKGVPEGASAIIPRRVCRDVEAESEFLSRTFGAVESVRRPGPDSPVVIYVYVEDVDATVDRALAGGATLVVPVATQFWGDRIGWVRDPEGHVWTIATRVEETSEDQRRERWSSILKTNDDLSST